MLSLFENSLSPDPVRLVRVMDRPWEPNSFRHSRRLPQSLKLLLRNQESCVVEIALEDRLVLPLHLLDVLGRVVVEGFNLPLLTVLRTDLQDFQLSVG